MGFQMKGANLVIKKSTHTYTISRILIYNNHA